MSQIIIVKDATNNKLRELESNASGELKVAASAMPLPSGASTETTLASVLADTNIIAEAMTECDTGAVVIASSALPAGASTEVSASATASSTSAINGKITACNTGAVVIASSALPAGAATEVSAGSCASSLSTLAGAVTANVVAVSHPASSASHTQVMSAVSNIASGTVKSTAVDANAHKSMCAWGSTDRATGEVNIEVSHNNSDWFELNNAYLSVDMTSGDFGIQMDISARYVRLSRTNTHASTEIIDAHISLK